MKVWIYILIELILISISVNELFPQTTNMAAQVVMFAVYTIDPQSSKISTLPKSVKLSIIPSLVEELKDTQINQSIKMTISISQNEPNIDKNNNSHTDIESIIIPSEFKEINLNNHFYLESINQNTWANSDKLLILTVTE
jgi:hypothetical protein